MLKKYLLTVLLLGVIQTGAIQSVHAAFLDFVPADQTVVLGTPVVVDVVISGLNEQKEIVSAFDLDVTYDSAVLSAIGVTFGSSLGDAMSFEVFEDVDLSTDGIIDFAALSVLSDVALDALQGDGLTVASLSFDSLGVGVSPLDFVLDQFNDVKGKNNAILALTVGDGNVNVKVAPVPVPSSLLLFGSGLVGLVGLRWFQTMKK